jgi:ABC-type Fe3+-hydroxamate transport system substrate-binding protein
VFGRYCFFLLRLILALLSVSLVHAMAAGAEATDQSPRRIVSLGPTITEKLYLLGAQDELVGVTTYCERPPEARAKEKIGNVTQVNIEKVVQLKPDLVLATPLTGERTAERLKHLGLRVVVFKDPNSFAEMNQQFLELGRIVGRAEQANEIVRASEQKVERIKSRVKGLPRPKVFVQIGARPLFTATKDSFLNDFIEFAGGTNIAAGAKTGLYSREEVLWQDPDVIIVVTMGLAAENEKKGWRRFKSISAVKHDRIVKMDPYKTCSPTPETFVEALEEMAKALHPGI